MEIRLYVNKSEPNRMTKELSNELILDGSLRNGVSILSPSFNLQRGQGITNYNYAYVPQFERYYFITDIKSVRNSFWNVSLSVDVLMSFADQIKNVMAIAERSENVFNLYLPDSEWRSDVRSLVQYKEIGSFKSFTPIIVVAGDVNDIPSGGE